MRYSIAKGVLSPYGHRWLDLPFLGSLLDHQLPRPIFVLTAGILVLAISSAFAIGRKDAGDRALRWGLKDT